MFRVMDEMEIAIQKISELRMVHIYELLGIDAQQMGKGCTAILVYANENDVLHMNAMDRYFDQLVQRVLEIYRETQNKDTILMDEDTGRLLEEGILLWKDEELEPFYQAEAVEEVTPLDAVLHKRFLPMVEYYITELAQMLGQKVVITLRNYGWRGRASLQGYAREKEVTYSMQIFAKGKDRYAIHVVNFPEKDDVFQLEVHIFRNRFEVRFCTANQKLQGRSSFRFGMETMLQEQEIYYDDKQIFLDRQEIPKQESIPDSLEILKQKDIPDGQENPRQKNISNLAEQLLYKDAIKAVYSLPWNMAYVLCDREEQGETSVIHRNCGTYLYPEADMTESYSAGEVVNAALQLSLQMDGVRMYQIRLRDGRVQTCFHHMEHVATGRYKQYLAGRCFVI